MAITNYQVGTGVGTAAYTASADTAVTVIHITNKTDGDGKNYFILNRCY